MNWLDCPDKNFIVLVLNSTDMIGWHKRGILKHWWMRFESAKSVCTVGISMEKQKGVYFYITERAVILWYCHHESKPLQFLLIRQLWSSNSTQNFLEKVCIFALMHCSPNKLNVKLTVHLKFYDLFCTVGTLWVLIEWHAKTALYNSCNTDRCTYKAMHTCLYYN